MHRDEIQTDLLFHRPTVRATQVMALANPSRRRGAPRRGLPAPGRPTRRTDRHRAGAHARRRPASGIERRVSPDSALQRECPAVILRREQLWVLLRQPEGDEAAHDAGYLGGEVAGPVIFVETLGAGRLLDLPILREPRIELEDPRVGHPVPKVRAQGDQAGLDLVLSAGRREVPGRNRGGRVILRCATIGGFLSGCSRIPGQCAFRRGRTRPSAGPPARGCAGP
jgi:hypothetical protein